ncbi:MAG: lamin tail domain-containing protein [Crocinitomicaceae bacterium]|nr:lamin tail domain-containing protein [Crocinitomicaceae bacterium]
MKKHFALFLLLLTVSILSAQTVQDNFTDGDFTSAPAWSGTDALFTVNASQQLQTSGTLSGQAYLTTSFASENLDNKEWNIWVRQNFSGSDQNQSRIYLTAQNSSLIYTGSGSAGTQGYFLKLGEGGASDAIKFCKDNGTGNIVELASGEAGLVAAAFAIRIKVTRNSAGLWTIYADATGGYNYNLQTSVTDNTYPTSTAMGMVCYYTATYASKFYFDDIYFGDIIVDTTPPSLISAVATDQNTVVASFSEPLNTLTAEDEGNYAAIGLTGPSSAVLSGSSTVTLTFSPILPNTPYTLQVNGVEDISGNVLNNGSTGFMFVVAGTAGYRGVVFNEVLADPSPAVPDGIPGIEFVELFNASEEAFNLNGWKFVNSTTAKTLPSFDLLPGQTVILARDTAVSYYPDAQGFIGFSSWTALSNSTDSLTLLDNNNEIIDILVYHDNWFVTAFKKEGGWTLEQVNPYLGCSNPSNWRESEDERGGTPGEENSVFDPTPDTSAPEILGVSIISPTDIHVDFSETMQASSISNIVLSIVPAVDIASVSWTSDLTGLIVMLDDPLPLGTTYSISIDGLNDCSGNEIDSGTVTFTLGFSPSPGDLIFNEIMADPDTGMASPQAEYIELFNRSENLIDLDGCKINNGIFNSQVLIEPGEYLIVANSTNWSYFTAFPDAVFINSFPGLTNSGVLLTLSDPDGNVIDQVDYKDTWYGDPAKIGNGWALELINPNDPCSSSDNWHASLSPSGATPGAINSVYDATPDTQAPQLISVYGQPAEAITLVFNEPLDISSIDNLTWSINGADAIPADANFFDTQYMSLVITVGQLDGGVIYHFVLNGISDCWGNVSTDITGQYALPVIPTAGDLIINEVLFNPYPGGQDFVELYNKSTHALTLANCYIGNEAGGVPASLRTITENNYLLFPGEYVVVTKSVESISAFYPMAHTDRILTIESMPSYNVDAGVVYLMMPDISVGDRFEYKDDMHFPLLEDQHGVSLERIDFNRPTDDETNWHSAAETVGFATPGYKNSQAENLGTINTQVEIFPEVFSPDNDGYEDITTISWHIDSNSSVGNIYIFDSEGRQVRYLMRNELLAESGSISWDGFAENRQALGIGIYVIYFEVFNTEGKVSKTKSSCVIAHKLN